MLLRASWTDGGLRRECWGHWPSLSVDLGIAVDIGDGSSALLFLPRSPVSLLSLCLLKVLGIVTNSHRRQLHTLLSPRQEAGGPCGHRSGTQGTQHREPGLFCGFVQLNRRDKGAPGQGPDDPVSAQHGICIHRGICIHHDTEESHQTSGTFPQGRTESATATWAPREPSEPL